MLSGRAGFAVLTLALATIGIAASPAQAAIHHPIRRARSRGPIHHIVHHPIVHHPIVHHPVRRLAWHHVVHYRAAPHHFVRHGFGMSCVPFARAASGIDLAGNAYEWWGHAAGRYARGDAPVPGSVLAFRANVRMHLGHVAVVSRVINRREIEVDQANWGNWGQITRGVKVIDVSEDNSWTDVRVALGDGRFGSVYPTFGFIYDRPDTGMMLAANRAPARTIAANPAPSRLRPIGGAAPLEFAEAPGRFPTPPHYPVRLGHSLHTHFVHHAPIHHAPVHHLPVHHVVYRHAVTHHLPVHHVIDRHATVHHAIVHHAAAHHVAVHHVAARYVAPKHHPVRG